jgi:predicted small secreted protein
MMSRSLAIVVASAAFVLAGCSWVKTTPGGEQVREATVADVGACQEVGTAVASTQATAAGIPRDKAVIRDEQVTLARNRAAQIGGDTIVQAGPPSGGTLTFTVYRCR